MILRQPVTVRLRQTMIDIRIGRRELKAQHLAGTAAGIDRLIQVIPTQGNLKAEIRRAPVAELLREQRIIGQIILRIVHRISQRKIIIRPVQLLAERDSYPKVFQRVGIAERIGAGPEIITPGTENAPIKADRKGVALFAAQPGFGERKIVGLVRLPVGLDTKAQLLAIPLRKRLPGLLMEDIPDREIRKSYSTLATLA